MKVSFELVPRSNDDIQKQLDFIQNNKCFNAMNVPDILRFETRSWQVPKINNISFIPHIRVMDFDFNTNTLYNLIRDNDLKEILLITGDKPNNISHKVFDTDIFTAITLIRKEFPNIIIYAGFDPYRSSIKEEIKTMKRKIECGADFLMSQPFFDKQLLKIYSEAIDTDKLFIGISPVVSEKSKNYWANVNNAIFPKDFIPSLEWNIDFALEIIEDAKDNGYNLYFMPIGIDIDKYFYSILPKLN